LGVQALSNTLPAAVEPRINISRRRNLRAMSGTHSIYFCLDKTITTIVI
jgi:hypothetical protein